MPKNVPVSKRLPMWQQNTPQQPTVVLAQSTSGGGGGGGVTQIVSGTNVTISPLGGTGVVTVNAAGGVPTSATWPVTTGSLLGTFYGITNGNPGRTLATYVGSGIAPMVINSGALLASASGLVAVPWERTVTLGNYMIAFAANINGGAATLQSGWTSIATSAGPNTYPACAYRVAGAGDVSSSTASPYSLPAAGAVCIIEVANASGTITASSGGSAPNISTTAGHLYLALGAAFGNTGFFDVFYRNMLAQMFCCGASGYISSNYFNSEIVAIPWLSSVLQTADATATGFIENTLEANFGGFILDVAPSTGTLGYWVPVGKF
jgi:hypothetical protein